MASAPGFASGAAGFYSGETARALVEGVNRRGGIWQLSDLAEYRVVERAPVQRLFMDAQHPYTIGLLGSIPQMHREQERLAVIHGQVPGPGASIAGCRFHPRCPFAIDVCRREEPPLVAKRPGHLAACWRAPLEP